MQTEYEIKILDINVSEAAKKLIAVGFEYIASLDFRRYIFDVSSEGAWIRLRTDGSKTTLTYKNFIKDVIDGMQEIEIIVDDFDKTYELLTVMGFEARQYQENKRQVYRRGELEVAIDSWPLIPPYLEIEGKNAKSVRACKSELGFLGHKTSSKPTSAIYKLYNLDLDNYKSLSFSTKV